MKNPGNACVTKTCGRRCVQHEKDCHKLAYKIYKVGQSEWMVVGVGWFQRWGWRWVDLSVIMAMEVFCFERCYGTLSRHFFKQTVVFLKDYQGLRPFLVYVEKRSENNHIYIYIYI